MSSSSSSRVRTVAAAVFVAAALAVGAGATAQESLRPEVGRPLQAAQELIKGGKYREALAKVREAEAAGARNANETYLIERMRLAAASGAGDPDTAARSRRACRGRRRSPISRRFTSARTSSSNTSRWRRCSPRRSASASPSSE